MNLRGVYPLLGDLRGLFHLQHPIWVHLLGANRSNRELSVLGSGYEQCQRSAAHVAVLNELAPRFGVHVDLDALEAIGADDLGRIVHLL